MLGSGESFDRKNTEAPLSGAISYSRDVFISYASQDASLANSVVEGLERNGITCWIAPRDVLAGDLYADGIIRAINGARLLVVVLSASAIASPHVGKEVERASSKRRHIIALRTDAAPLTTSLEYFLSESQWVDLLSEGLESALTKLIIAVRIQISSPTLVVPDISAYSFGARPAAEKRRKSWLLATVIGLVTLIAIGLAEVNYWMQARFSTNSARMTVPAGVSIQYTAPERSVAVLPFVDMSEKKDQEYFSDGMSEELIDKLAKLPALKVSARTSSFYFKGRPTTILDIAKALGVTYVLEGSVRKSGKTLRVTTQLIRADTGYHLWSETYDRQLDDVFKVQDDIAQAVVGALKVSLGGESPSGTGTPSVEAYNWYLQARAIYQHAGDRPDYAHVVDYLRKALDLDPQFSKAWVLLSVALTLQGEYGFEPANQVESTARTAAQRALELDPTSAEAHIAVARIMVVDDLDLRGAELHVRQAVELDPNNPWVLSYVATIASQKGQFDKALGAIEKSISADPVNPYRYENLADILYCGRRYSESLQAYRKMLELSPGITGESLPLYQAELLLSSGQPQAALNLLDRGTIDAPGLKGGLVGNTLLLRAIAYADLGRSTEADRQLAQLETNHAKDMGFAIGLVYASRGNVNKAFEWFDKAYRLRDNGLLYLKVHPILKNVQSDPRFDQLLIKIGLKS